MVDLWKELERRKEKRLTRARFIWHSRLFLCFVVVALGLINYFLLGTLYRLEPEGSLARIVAVVLQCVSVGVQLGILWLMWWGWKVSQHDQRKL